MWLTVHSLTNSCIPCRNTCCSAVSCKYAHVRHMFNKMCHLLFQVSHSYSLRSRASSSDDTCSTEGAQLIPVLNPIKGEALAAGSSTSQMMFLKAVGMVSADVVTETDPVLSDSDAIILSCAMRHEMIRDGGLTDPYFTKEEWAKVQEKRKTLLKDARVIFEDMRDNGGDGKADAVEWLTRADEEPPLCGCIAHSSSDLYDFIAPLFEISSPLTDDSGNRLGATLLSFILKAAKLQHKLKFETVKAGSRSTVNYILQFPSGETSMFTGWADFEILECFSFYERRMRNSRLLREHRVRGIGEIQSPQGTSADAKTAALAQAGIYSVGHFAKFDRDEVKRTVATILLYKDMTAHVALAKIDPSKVTSDEALGEISYKLCNSVHPYKLYNPEGLASFASTFIGALKEAMVCV